MSLPPLATAEPKIITAATGLLQALWTADLRGLPIPFSSRAWESGRISLLMRTRDEVVRWAEALGVDLDSDGAHVSASGELLDVPVVVSAYVGGAR